MRAPRSARSRRPGRQWGSTDDTAGSMFAAVMLGSPPWPLAFAAAPVSASSSQTSRDQQGVTTLTASVYARCDPSSPAASCCSAATLVTIESVNEGWVQVRTVSWWRAGLHAPQRARGDAGRRSRGGGAAGPRGRPGARGHADARRQRRPVAGAGRSSASTRSYLTASRTFGDTRTFDLYAETGAASRRAYQVEGARRRRCRRLRPRRGRDLAAGVRVHDAQGRRASIAITGSIPHPFLFGHDRGIEGTAPGTRRRPPCICRSPTSYRPGRRCRSWCSAARASSRSSSRWSPASRTTRTIRSTRRPSPAPTWTNEKEKKTGFNVGADVGYYFTKNVGVGGIVRFAQTKVTFSLGEVDAGGAMVGGGVRLRF